MNLSARSHTYHATARATRPLLEAPRALQPVHSNREHFQSSGWTALLTSSTTHSSPLPPSPPPPMPPHPPHTTRARTTPQKRWRACSSGAASGAAGQDSNRGNIMFTASQLPSRPRPTPQRRHRPTTRTAQRSRQARATTVQSPPRANRHLHAGGGTATTATISMTTTATAAITAAAAATHGRCADA